MVHRYSICLVSGTDILVHTGKYARVCICFSRNRSVVFEVEIQIILGRSETPVYTVHTQETCYLYDMYPLFVFKIYTGGLPLFYINSSELAVTQILSKGQ